MRTIQVLGKAYSETGTVNMACNIAGLGQVFNGPVPTVNGPAPEQNNEFEVLFQFDVANTVHHTVIASDITVTNGTGYIVCIAANKLNPADWSQFITLFRNTADLKNDVRLDGVLVDVVEPDDGWHYEIPAGSTLSIDWKLNKVPRFVPGRTWHKPDELQVGVEYVITIAGDSDFTAAGAADNNAGTTFTATGIATGTSGRARPTQPMA